MFSINGDKAPRLNGFSASFFQANWTTLGPAIVKEVQHIFRNGKVPDSINKTYIRLIPKVQSPKIVVEYGPIALCNAYCKVV